MNYNVKQTNLEFVWYCGSNCILKYFLLENIWKFIIYYFLKFIFNINILKWSKNTKKNLKKKTLKLFIKIFSNHKKKKYTRLKRTYTRVNHPWTS